MKLSSFAKVMLTERYMKKYDDRPEDVFTRAIKAFASNEDHFKRLLSYVESRWFIPSTPILANSPIRVKWSEDHFENFRRKMYRPDTIDAGMPISCFVQYVDDSVYGLTSSATESRYMSIAGGGVGSYFGSIRSNIEGSKSPGPIPFIKCLDSDTLAYHQHGTRRSGIAVYLDIDHPDIEEFLIGRNATGGDVNRKFINLHHGVCINNDFLEAVKYNLTINLVDRKTKKTVKTINALDLWLRILEIRHKTGEPYIINMDTINENLHPALKEKGKVVWSSNLCSEIVLPTDPERSALCCLSSVNLEYYDSWNKNKDFISDCVEFLDNVLTYFVIHADRKQYGRVVRAVIEERNIGLGAMGFHSYLQRRMIPFESAIAASRARVMHKHIYNKAKEATKMLANERGEATDLVGYGERNAHLIAIAPNASTSVILGTSPGIEPLKANAYLHKLDTGVNIVKNRYLIKLLEDKDLDVDKIMDKVMSNKGSVMGIRELSKEEKDVFKTAIELDQHWIVEHAIMRQPFIDQAASTNLFFPAEVDISYLHSVHWKAMTNGVKTLYYVRSEPIKSAKIVSNPDVSTCLSCEG